MRYTTLILALMLFTVHLEAQDRGIRIWENVPGMSNKKTTMWVYPAKDSLNTGISVLVLPGGSYSHTMGIKVEGFGVAEWLSMNGITAFVLKYRTGNAGWHHPAMIEDLQRAMQIIREGCESFDIDSSKVGTMGFSAGGHLSLMSAIYPDKNFLNPLGIDVKCKLSPDFSVAIYPVISMQDDIVHKRSRYNLLTRRCSEEQKNQFSLELNVKSDMVPVFLSVCKDDQVVNYINSVRMDEALTNAGVNHKFLLYENGNHGYGGSEEHAPEAAKWKYEFIKWLNNVYSAN